MCNLGVTFVACGVCLALSSPARPQAPRSASDELAKFGATLDFIRERRMQDYRITAPGHRRGEVP